MTTPEGTPAAAERAQDRRGRARAMRNVLLTVGLLGAALLIGMAAQRLAHPRIGAFDGAQLKANREEVLARIEKTSAKITEDVINLGGPHTQHEAGTLEHAVVVGREAQTTLEVELLILNRYQKGSDAFRKYIDAAVQGGMPALDDPHAVDRLFTWLRQSPKGNAFLTGCPAQ